MQCMCVEQAAKAKAVEPDVVKTEVVDTGVDRTGSEVGAQLQFSTDQR